MFCKNCENTVLQPANDAMVPDPTAQIMPYICPNCGIIVDVKYSNTCPNAKRQFTQTAVIAAMQGLLANPEYMNWWIRENGAVSDWAESVCIEANDQAERLTEEYFVRGHRFE